MAPQNTSDQRRRTKLPPIPGPVSELQLTAYHEAGHLAFGFAHDESAVWVSIVPHHESDGRVHRTWGWSDDEVAQLGPEVAGWVVDEVTLDARCRLAGLVAEAIRAAQARGEVDAQVAYREYIGRVRSHDPDLEQAWQIASRLHPATDATKEWTREQIRTVIEVFLDRPRLWSAVAALAAALIEHAEFDGRHAMWLYEQVMAGRSFLGVQREFSARLRAEPGWRRDYLGAWAESRASRG